MTCKAYFSGYGGEFYSLVSAFFLVFQPADQLIQFLSKHREKVLDHFQFETAAVSSVFVAAHGNQSFPVRMTHRDDDGTFIYRATISRDEAQRQSVQQMLDTVFRGSTEGLVLTLLENQSLSKAEAARIRKMIREAEERS